MKKQCYMTAGERHQLEAMRRNKIPIAEIARQLNRSRQTIYNELRRGSYLHTVDYQDVVRYSADKGQAIRELASKCKGRRIKTENDADYMDFLEYMILKGKYSPAAALAEARAVGYTTTICVTTLYSYISKRRFPRLRDMDLLEKVSRRHRKKSEEPRIVHKDYPSIEVRPEHIGQRSEGGHWEMDLIVGCRGSKAVLLTLTERRSRQEIIMKLPDRRAETIRRAIDRLERRGVPFNILTVVNAQTAPRIREIYRDYMARGWVYQQYIPCLDLLGETPGGHPWSLTADAYGTFLCELFDLWYEDRRNGVFVYNRYFENLAALLALCRTTREVP